MIHRCKCKPGKQWTWSNSELQAALDFHIEARLVLGTQTYELVSQRIPLTQIHTVKLVDVT